MTAQARSSAALFLSMSVFLSGCGHKKELQPLSSVMLSAITEPAVFKVLTIAEYQLRDVRFLRNTTALAAISSSPDCWASVASNPGAYLSTSPRSDRIIKVRKHFASGSSFAVTQDGVFLTNAHVVAAPDTSKLDEVFPAVADSLSSVVAGLRPSVSSRFDWMVNLRGMGGSVGCGSALPEDAEFRKAFVMNLATWMLRQTLAGAVTGAVYVVTRPRQATLNLFPRDSIFTNKYDLYMRGLRPSPWALAPLTPPAPPDPNEIEVKLESTWDNPSSYATEVTIAADGQTFPGEDVAVLRAKTPLELIALPLGDSSSAEVPDGSPIVAFGFPGAAEMAGLKKDEAHPKVIAHDGKMVQRVTTDKDWEALYITAAISEGDSGGPIVDRFGRVIALNDYGNQNRAGNNVGVPINLAKKYLDQAKLHATTGSLTAHWVAGQDYYAQGEYAKALQEFEIVNGTRADPEIHQKFATRLKGLLDSKPEGIPVGRGNDYVLQAIANCKFKLHER